MNKRYIAINTHLILFFVLFFVFPGLSIGCAIGNETGLSVMFALFILLPIFVYVISPLYFVFSDDSIEIVYNFGLKEQIKWSEIRNISSMGCWIGKGGDLPHYVIAYPKKEKRPFFVVGEVTKSAKTTELIKKYYKKKIA